MATDLRHVGDHPSVLLDENHPMQALLLRIHERGHDVTFAALDNEALKDVREAYAQSLGGYHPTVGEIARNLRDLMDAVDRLLGME